MENERESLVSFVQSPPLPERCDAWTYFGDPSWPHVARCDLEPNHGGMHKFWTNPEAGESYSWSDKGARHI